MLVLKPQINLETKIVEIQKDYVVFACSVIATHSNGCKEVLEIFYQTITKEDFNKLNLKDNSVILSLPGIIESPYYENVSRIYFDNNFLSYKNLDFLFSQPTRGPNFI